MPLLDIGDKFPALTIEVAGGFVLDPDGRVVVSVYSSGAIGRLVPEDARGLIRYVRELESA